ncbi:hypothetical protein ABZ801_34845 [Actinomadura sp. NPDC047616]|uniref:nSTAND1 domain-containing NTPase n=1 Tax=Actinomadura sp. NPDC047616 TaxID=3155914 RepID=UPI0033F4AFF0
MDDQEAARDWPRAGLDAPTVRASLAAAPDQAHLLIRQAVDTDARRRGLPADQAGSRRLVLVVDQFEELFTTPEGGTGGADEGGAGGAAGEGAAETAAFITALHAAATVPCGPADAPAALVLIAVRGDFVDRCADHQVLAAAKARGRVGGRPTVVNEDLIRAARDMLPNPEHSVTSIAKLLGVSPGTLYNHIPDLRVACGRAHAAAGGDRVNDARLCTRKRPGSLMGRDRRGAWPR